MKSQSIFKVILFFLIIVVVLMAIVTLNKTNSETVQTESGSTETVITSDPPEVEISFEDEEYSSAEELVSETFDYKKFANEDFDDAIETFKEEEKIQSKYDRLKHVPQSICGRLSLAEGVDLKKNEAITLQLRTSERNARMDEAILDCNGCFAFEPVEPGKYTVILFETKTNPGVHYRNIEVTKDYDLPDLDIPLPTGRVLVRLVDDNDDPVSGARITVGKADAPSGSNRNFFTFRIGTSDASGQFVANNLTDGRYVVSASFGTIEASDIIELSADGKTEHTLQIRTSGSQVTGNLGRRDPMLNPSYPVILEGEDLQGNRIARAINSDSKGDYAISYLPAGTYRVYIQQTGHFSGTDAVVEITKENETIRDIDLEVYYPEELSSIKGAVSNIGKYADSELHVLAMSENGVLRTYAVADRSSGEYLLKDLAPGNYKLLLMEVNDSYAQPLELASVGVGVESVASTYEATFNLAD